MFCLRVNKKKRTPPSTTTTTTTITITITSSTRILIHMLIHILINVLIHKSSSKVPSFCPGLIEHAFSFLDCLAGSDQLCTPRFGRLLLVVTNTYLVMILFQLYRLVWIPMSSQFWVVVFLSSTTVHNGPWARENGYFAVKWTAAQLGIDGILRLPDFVLRWSWSSRLEPNGFCPQTSTLWKSPQISGDKSNPPKDLPLKTCKNHPSRHWI